MRFVAFPSLSWYNCVATQRKTIEIMNEINIITTIYGGKHKLSIPIFENFYLKDKTA